MSRAWSVPGLKRALMMRFAPRVASGPAVAIRAASAFADCRRSSDEWIACTSPNVSISLASIVLPVPISSRARPRPAISANREGPPAPGNPPHAASGNCIVACDAARRISHAKANSAPPARTSPLRAAMTVWGASSSASNARLAKRTRATTSSFVIAPRMAGFSIPDEKSRRPSPKIKTAWIDVLDASSCPMRSSSPSASGSNRFRSSGIEMQIRRTAPWASTTSPFCVIRSLSSSIGSVTGARDVLH